MTLDTIRLGDLGTWYGGGTPSKARNDFWVNGTVPWLSPKDMGHDVLQCTQDSITDLAVEESSVKLVPSGSVAVVVRSGILERRLPVGLVPFATTLNQDMKALHPREGVDARWVAWGLRAFERDLLRQTRKDGTTVASIEWPRFQQFELRVPPLEEQRRVVDFLESQLSGLDAADAGLARASRSSRAMVQSALSAGLRGSLVEDDVTEGTAGDLLGSRPDFVANDDERVWEVPDTWAWARLGDVFEVNIGATPSRALQGHWEGDLPWVSSGEVAFGRISSTREHINREAAGNPLTRIHAPGTVMLAMIGEGKTRGQAAILDVTAAHNQNCASIRVSATEILPEYIYGYLEERYIETRRGGAGAQQPALNKAAIQRFPVPIAPLGTQRRLVDAWDSARDAATRLQGQLEMAQRWRVSLRRSLLANAFSGQVVTEMATV